MEKWKYPLGNSFSDRCDSFSDRCDSELCLPACLLASPLSLACRLPGLPGFSASMASSQRGYDSISICCRAITSDALSLESSRCHLFSRIMASSSKHYHLMFTRDIALSLHIEYESPRCIVLSSECGPLPYGGRLPTSRSTTTKWMRLPGMLGGGRGGQRGREGGHEKARLEVWVMHEVRGGINVGEKRAMCVAVYTKVSSSKATDPRDACLQRGYMGYVGYMRFLGFVLLATLLYFPSHCPACVAPMRAGI